MKNEFGIQGSFAQYKAFVNVYENKGYAGASKAINKGDAEKRTTLQTNVKKLEDEILGVKLFVQVTRTSIKPTPEGDYLYKQIAEPLARIEEAEYEISNFSKNSFFVIRVAIPIIFSHEQFESFSHEFRKEYVKAEIEFITADCTEALRNKKVDFAISLKGELVDKSFMLKDLCEDNYTRMISCAYAKGSLTKGQRTFISYLEKYCDLEKQFGKFKNKKIVSCI